MTRGRAKGGLLPDARRTRQSDGQPSAALAARCDAAIGVMNANPASRAILCGGQGGDEPRTEAEAMRDYMTAHGADRRG